MFGELWIDRPTEYEARIGSFEGTLRTRLEHFVEHGYVIIEGCVDDDTIDEVLHDVESFERCPKKFVMRRAGKYIDPVGHGDLTFQDRIIDLYAISPAARRAIYAPQALEFFKAIFGGDVLTIQSLYFQYGSQQAIHQDTAYVVSQKPLSLSAIWIALEDVSEGAGELQYYPGSHRFDPFLFKDGRKSWAKNIDGPEKHKEYLQQLHTQADERGIETQSFVPKKGDVLIWHADLAHGGARVTDTLRTRKSLVAHQVPRAVKPKYFKTLGHRYAEFHSGDDGYFSSRHFDLKKLTRNGVAPILYDAGITKKRKGLW
ncbi:MAG: phytanoyl-CoA dioxygenase family protein [Pseudomonadota bacterium]